MFLFMPGHNIGVSSYPLSLYTRNLAAEHVTRNNAYYIPAITIASPAGCVCRLGRHVSEHVCHLRVRFYLQFILSYDGKLN
jgi:hypothetical protein